ncbi:MAG: HIRAN domain-containing protein [Pyrinomonadaceae bacterium]
MKTLFLAWQDPTSRRWFTIGRLTFDEKVYRFVYTRGIQAAQIESNFQPLLAFPDLHVEYESEELFPLFSNRLLPRSRPDYAEFVQWLSVPEHENDPMALLARSGGQRVTDALEVFPCPEPDAHGEYHLHFFVHGLSHMPPASLERAERLQPGEPLLLLHDFQNPRDPRALMMRTSESLPQDMYLMGYCPRYLLNDIAEEVTRKNKNQVEITVERVNSPPAPVQLRILCRMRMRRADEFKPFSGAEYQPLELEAVV